MRQIVLSAAPLNGWDGNPADLALAGGVAVAAALLAWLLLIAVRARANRTAKEPRRGGATFRLILTVLFGVSTALLLCQGLTPPFGGAAPPTTPAEVPYHEFTITAGGRTATVRFSRVVIDGRTAWVTDEITNGVVRVVHPVHPDGRDDYPAVGLSPDEWRRIANGLAARLGCKQAYVPDGRAVDRTGLRLLTKREHQALREHIPREWYHAIGWLTANPEAPAVMHPIGQKLRFPFPNGPADLIGNVSEIGEELNGEPHPYTRNGLDCESDPADPDECLCHAFSPDELAVIGHTVGARLVVTELPP